ncbi:HEAT repeat domain-containing protein [Halobacillus massiliensis]|uniref:HEAT repeat domain-containing protein n=1 Tax=Halobacillus massiliensis TaxID=1926286 RepID=UPI0009E62FBE|nr:HEAT repeat domain-containing protein [Halobacillus massiliensis]
MDSFLKRVEPYWNTSDETVLKIIMLSLRGQAGIPDRLIAESLRNSRQNGWFPYISWLNGITLKEEAVQELTVSLKASENPHFFQPLIEKIDIGVLARYKDELYSFITNDVWDYYEKILSCNTKNELYPLYTEIIRKLDENYEPQFLISAKMAVDYMVKKNWMDGEEAVGELEEALQSPSTSFHTAMNAYALSYFPDDRYVYPLVKALTSEDILLRGMAAQTLCTYHSSAVIEELYPLCQMEEETLPLQVLIQIKTDEALQALRQLYSESKDLEYREAIVEGMCLHFSEDTLHEIEEFMEQGQFTGLIDLDEVTYVYYKVVDLDRIRLLLWKDHEEQESS